MDGLIAVTVLLGLGAAVGVEWLASDPALPTSRRAE
jgi:hypothetical protein